MMMQPNLHDPYGKDDRDRELGQCFRYERLDEDGCFGVSRTCSRWYVTLMERVTHGCERVLMFLVTLALLAFFGGCYGG